MPKSFGSFTMINAEIYSLSPSLPSCLSELITQKVFASSQRQWYGCKAETILYRIYEFQNFPVVLSWSSSSFNKKRKWLSDCLLLQVHWNHKWPKSIFYFKTFISLKLFFIDFFLSSIDFIISSRTNLKWGSAVPVWNRKFGKVK